MATVNLVDFDPNVDTFWLACMSGRWKASLKRSGALNVFGNWEKGKLYKVEGGRFHLIADKNPDTHNGDCDRCGQNIKDAARIHGMWARSNGYDWLRQNGKIVEPLTLVRLCVECP